MTADINPLIDSTAPVPAFDRIKPEHFMPALDAAIEKAKLALDRIRNDETTPSFANTVVPLESFAREIDAIQGVLYYFYGNFKTDEISETVVAVDTKVSEFNKDVFQDPALIARFKPIHDAKDRLNLDADDTSILDDLFQSFESSGGFVDEQKHPGGQQRIREIDARLIELCNSYVNNLSKDGLRQAVWVTDEKELAGLSAEDISGFEKNAADHKLPGGWLTMPERLSVDGLLEQAADSNFRRRVYEALNRMGTGAPNPVPPPYPEPEAGDCDNHANVAEIHALRQEYAALLDYPDYATFARTRTCTEDAAYVHNTLDELSQKILPRYEADMRSLENFAKQQGGPSKLEPWDVTYWAAKQKHALYDFDPAAFSQYLELEGAMKGLFTQAETLFKIEFRPAPAGKYPLAHEDVKPYDVYDLESGKQIGIVLADFYARSGTKDGGAWMAPIQDKTGFRPNLIGINQNAQKPAPGATSYLNMGDYETLYHEWGHMLQGLIGTNVKYTSLQGVAGPADFTEIHSTMNEPRAFAKETLKEFARDKNGNPPPDDLIDRLIGAKNFFKSWDTLRLIQNSLRDIEYHTVKNFTGEEAIDAKADLKSPYAAHLHLRPLVRFDHLFSGPHDGYAAGYNNYLLAGIRAAAAYAPFEEKGPFDPATSDKLRKFYQRGSGGDSMAVLEEYLGHKVTLAPYLRSLGIDTPSAGPSTGPSAPAP